jgi:WD40 repeat protein
MRVERPDSYSLSELMLKQIASHPEMRSAFYEGSSETSILDEAETSYIAETLRRYNQKPIYTHEKLPNSRYTAGTFNHSGSSIALGSNQGLLQIVDITPKEEISTIAERLSPIESLAYSPDDRYITSIDRNHIVHVRIIENSILSATYNELELPAAEERSATISTDGSTLARQTSDYATQLWHIGIDGLILQNVLPTDMRVHQLCLSPDNSQLFVVHAAHSRLYNTATGALLCSMPHHLSHATFSGNGAWIAAACSRGAFFNYLYIFSIKHPSLRPKKIKMGRNDPNTSITALATNDDCSRVAVYVALSGISNYRLNIYSTQIKPISITHSFRSSWRASKLLLSPDETQLVAFGESSIALWDLCLKKHITGLLPEHREFLLACAPFWERREQYPVDHTNEHYQYLIKYVPLFKHNTVKLFTYPDPTTDEEPPCPKRARHG